MFAARRLLLSCKQGANQAASFLRGKKNCRRRIQSANYSQSTRQGTTHGRTDLNPLPVGTAQTFSRSRARYAAPALALGFTGFLAFLHYNDERRAVPKGQPSSSNSSGCGCGSNTTVRGPIIGGPFTLMSTQNKVVTEKDLRDKWVLLYFGYSFSPDVGPEQLKMISKAVDKLESNHDKKVLPVFVTLDPVRDTPSHLHAYLKEFDDRILGLTGSASAMRQMAQEYRVYFKKVQEDGDDYLVDTSHNMYLLNPKMEVVRCFGVEYNPGDLSQEVLKEVTSASQ
ncbi:hypothetical protein HID58_030253 [Brassica napus]|uniref:Protein SCO1 homolog 2, mitochondrial n=2 Tax=Brassica TaxID=3705 RepID=A0ABQ8CFE6_BRANA|nr:protein SCO1 homolog 2, mitochondrial isoform X1 [Brassica napus]KAH0915807.1 hypothetical protein HID58_030253 [Brassica napus]VDD05928.1 unnamed protein product [Brassica rapa]